MTWLAQKLRLPASESSMGVVLALCVVAMSLLSIALLWQAEIIANQRELIRWMQAGRLGG